MLSVWHLNTLSETIPSKGWWRSCLPCFVFFFLCCAAEARNAESIEYTVEGKKVAKNAYKAILLVNDSIGLIKKNAYDRALGKLKHAALIAPDLAQPHICAGVIYARQNRNADAIAELRKAVACKDAPATAYTTLGSLYQTSGDLDGAIATFKAMGKKYSDAALLDRSDKILALLERERDRRQKATGSSKGGSSQNDYMQDAMQYGFHKVSLSHAFESICGACC